MSRLFLLLVAVLLTAPAAGQALSTDRPDFGAGTAVLPVRTVQLEAGVKRTRDGSVDADQIMESLLRYGLAAPIELRIGWAGVNRLSDNNEAFSGAGDLSFGVKLELAAGGGWKPAASILGTLTIPSGEDGFSVGEEVPELRIALAWPLGSQFGLTLNAGSFWTTVPRGLLGGGGDSRESNEFWSATVGRSGDGGHSLYLEVFGITPAIGRGHQSLGLGYLYLFNPRMQLDLYAGTGLNAAAPDVYVGAGFSVRLPD
jgi:hypothetical protein